MTFSYKEWYEKNKDRHKQYINTKIDCECGARISRGNLTQHKSTKKHTNGLAAKQQKQNNIMTPNLIDTLNKLTEEIKQLKDSRDLKI